MRSFTSLLVRLSGLVSFLGSMILLQGCPESVEPIFHPSVVATVYSNGTTVRLDGVAIATFASHSFLGDHSVRIETTSNSDFAEFFRLLGQPYTTGPRIGYEIRINTGSVPPAHDVEISVTIPDSTLRAVPAGSSIEAWLDVEELGDHEIMDVFEVPNSTFDPSTGMLSFTIPATAFHNAHTRGDYEAVFTLAPVVGKQRIGDTAVSTPDPSTCQGSSLVYPLNHPIAEVAP